MTALDPKHLHHPQHQRRASQHRVKFLVIGLAATTALVATVVSGATATTAKHGFIEDLTREQTNAAQAAANTPQSTNSKQVTNTGKIDFGVDGTMSQVAKTVNVDRHIYGQLNSHVPVARMVTMGPGNSNYAAIASAQPGSSVYNNIVRWADTIKSRGTLTYFGFTHEPESKFQAKFGSTSQYIAAFRHVVTIFRAQHLSNVRYVWQMTAYGFVRKDSHAAANYYPGNSYVDIVASDAYNWFGCGSGGPWRDLAGIAQPTLDFAKAHNKLAMLAEFASEIGPQRATWLKNAQAYFIQNRFNLVAAFYFDRTPTQGPGCDFQLHSSADQNAFRAIANDTAYFTP